MNAIALTLVSVGVSGLLLALYPTFQICSESEYQRKGWLLLLAMILLFIIGYLGFIWILLGAQIRFTEMVLATILFGGGGFVFAVTRMSRTSIIQMQNALNVKHYQAHHDLLTRLPNRTRFYERLENLIGQEPQAFCCMMMDINDFKNINDTLGHAQGDHVLSVVAKRIREVIPLHAMAARIGGDEFTVLLPGTLAEDATEVALDIQAALQRDIQCEEHLLVLGISIGIAQYPIHGEDRKSLLKHSDIAMYIAKQKESHIQIYSPFDAPQTHTQISLSS